MAAVLKLVHPAPSSSEHPRPIQTYYYGSVRSQITAWSKITRAASPLGAVRASMSKLFLGLYREAHVYSEDGVRLYVLRREGRTIYILGHFM